jgi:CHAD domain-containing protein
VSQPPAEHSRPAAFRSNVEVLARRVAVPLGYPLDRAPAAFDEALRHGDARAAVLARIARRAHRLAARSIDATLTDRALRVAIDTDLDELPPPGVLEREAERAFGVPLAFDRSDFVRIPPPTSDEPALSATATLALGWLARIQSMEAECVHGEDPEGPHQLRVGVRRLRTTLRLLERLQPKGALRDVVIRVRALGDLAGAVRDTDVVASRVAALDVSDEAREAARVQIERRRARALERLRRVLLSRNAASSVEHVHTALALIARMPTDVRIDVAARDHLDRCFRQFTKQTHDGVVDGEAYHALRRRIRRIRDCIEVFGPALKKRDVAWRKRLQPVQSRLGELNDIETALRLVPDSIMRARPVRTALERQRLDTLCELAVPLMLTIVMAAER